jgi:3-dehydroquinate synthase
MDHEQFDGPLLKKATAAILKTRDGKLRAAVPVSPMGKCVFLNDVSHDEMCHALQVHKETMKSYPRNGEGIDAYVDSSDTGYTIQGAPVEANGKVPNGDSVPRSLAAGQGLNGSVNAAFIDGLKDKLEGRDASHVNVVVVDGNGSS